MHRRGRCGADRHAQGDGVDGSGACVIVVAPEATHELREAALAKRLAYREKAFDAADLLTSRSSSRRPAFPRKTSGDAFTTHSDTPQFPLEVFFVDHEHVDSTSCELLKEARSVHVRCFSRALHRDRSLLVPVNRGRDAHLAFELVRRLSQRRKQAVGHTDRELGHRR